MYRLGRTCISAKGSLPKSFAQQFHNDWEVEEPHYKGAHVLPSPYMLCKKKIERQVSLPQSFEWSNSTLHHDLRRFCRERQTFQTLLPGFFSSLLKSVWWYWRSSDSPCLQGPNKEKQGHHGFFFSNSWWQLAPSLCGGICKTGEKMLSSIV